MKPVHHLLFGFVVTMGFFALFLPDHINWQVVFLATVSGFLPDFDHREWLWGLISWALFIGFFLFFANSLYASMPTDILLVVVGSLAGAAIVSWAIYAAHPFTGTIMDLSDKRLQFWGAEGWFLALYVLIVFAITLSPALAVAAFVGYSSHWVLDRIAYYTYFGRKYLVHYPRPEFGPKWQIRRQQLAEIAKRKAKKEKEEKKGKEKRTEKGTNKGKPTSKHAFLGAGMTEEAGGHEDEREQDLGEHSLASDEQVLGEPEEHHEEAHGGIAGH